jgi:tRNA-Thr(GGU) m(6)t(6)A37 methyltransferase TsaA
MPDSSYMDDLEMGLFVKQNPPTPTVVSLAIGKVVSNRKAVIDDNWESVDSYVMLDGNQFSAEALLGLDLFSHAEVIFFMDQVDVRKIENSARHPRNNPDWPKTGIFAQRGKNRPNQIGVTICRVKKIDGLNVHLEGLDAVDGTPVLDIKPWIKEFAPRGETYQPNWASELMKDYWE